MPDARNRADPSLPTIPPLSPHAATVTVRRFPLEGKVWLQHRDGEGGVFDAAEVAQVIIRGRSLEAYFHEKF
jgi:hypothetical protein